MKEIVLIDDDRALCRSLEIQLRENDYEVFSAFNGKDGLALVFEKKPHFIFTDLMLPDMKGLEILEEIRNHGIESPVIMISGHQDMKATIEAIRLGAIDYIRKPFGLDEILIAIEKWEKSHVDKERVELEEVQQNRREIVGKSRAILEVVKQIGLFSQSRVTVLVQGESGTGKELVARALHESSTPDKPFVAVNASAVVPTLLESELFGHEKGAFTGADSRKIGKLEQAEDGTIFFDEIAEMSLDLQTKLLRVLQEKEFERVGGHQTIPLKARIISATHQQLEKLVQDGKFRQDLFYRLAVSRIVVPPLRGRKEDIPLIVHYLMAQIANDFNRPFKSIDKNAMKRLQTYDWPGNIRELENVLTQGMALSRNMILTEEAISGLLSAKPKEEKISDQDIKPLWIIEKKYIASALAKTEWNITRTAKSLEISPTTLRKKISDYKLTPIT